MKVLKEGDDVEWRKITCNCCNSDLEIDAADIWTNRSSYAAEEYYIFCPNCKYKIVMNTSYIPPHVKKQAKDLIFRIY